MFSYCKRTSSVIKGFISPQNKVRTQWQHAKPFIIWILAILLASVFFIPSRLTQCISIEMISLKSPDQSCVVILPTFNMFFALPGMSITSARILPNTFTMLSTMKDFHKHLWNGNTEVCKQVLDFFNGFEITIQGYWNTLM